MNSMVSVLLIALLGTLAATQVQDAQNLSFQADIYGSSAPEIIEYLSDLSFHNFGGFGVNAHVYRASLRSGDGIAYAISSDDLYAFTFNVSVGAGEPITLTMTPSQYSEGVVTMTSPSELHFVWEIEESGLHIKLHRRVELVSDSRVNVQNIIGETFSIENLGTGFTLNEFSEYLHMDDRAGSRDFDNEGDSETLLAINKYSTDGYPVFGKVYLRRQDISIELRRDEHYATVNHPLNKKFSSDSEQDIVEAAYVSSTSRNGTDAEQQVTDDAKRLLGIPVPDRWQVRSYNTDDAGGVFINGLMLAGSMYSYYPDSGWYLVNDYWRESDDNFVSFASWDAGGCCSSTWGFSIKHNAEILWDVQGSGPTREGIVFSDTLKVSSTGIVTDYEQIRPTTTLSGSWYVQVRANRGSGFALVDNFPVAGSTWNQAQWVEITNLLGPFDNHIHFNAWSDGRGSHEWYFAIRQDSTIVWKNQMEIENSQRDRVHHMHLVIDKDGNVYPKLDFPVDYLERTNGSMVNFSAAYNTRVTSMFDHRYPTYTFDDKFLPYTGVELDNPDGNCSISRHNCYDGHNGFDIDDLCSQQAPCSDQTAVYPAADGSIVMTKTGWIDNDLGCQVVVDHGSGWTTLYAHLKDPRGDHSCDGILRSSGFVTRFAQIAVIGGTGYGGGGDSNSHMHFEVRHNGIAVDPSGWDPAPQEFVDPWANHANGTSSYLLWLYRDRIIQTINPSSGGQLASLTNQTLVSIPSGFYDVPLKFNLSDTPVVNPSDQLLTTGHSFSLSATDGAGNPVEQLDTYFTLKVNFDASRIQGLKPNTLSFYNWDELTSTWIPISTTIDLENLTATAQINHLSFFALMGKSKDKIFLPIVTRLPTMSY